MKNTGLSSFFIKLIKRYYEDEIGNTSAALAYYLIFSFFPAIVFISTLLGYIDISPEIVFDTFYGILPNDILDIVSKYLAYLNENTNTNMLMVSLFFTVYFLIRTVSKVMDGINRAYRVDSTRGILKKLILMIIFSMVFVMALGCIFLLLIIGKNILYFISNYILISREFIELWGIVRFIAIAGIAFLMLSFFYWAVPECKVKLIEVLPGAGLSVVCWVVFSAGFSFYVENLGNYSILFGSIGAIIVLLVWLYTMSAVLLMGAEINSALKEVRKEKNKYKN